PPRHDRHLPAPQPNVRTRYRRLPNRLRPGLLPLTDGRLRRNRYGRRHRPPDRISSVEHQYRLVYPFCERDIRGGVADGPSEVAGGLSGGFALWVFRAVKYFQCEEI
ncbi:hypothetical protein I317_07792, partial [Kwoniella heveanensis CBS 569]